MTETVAPASSRPAWWEKWRAEKPARSPQDQLRALRESWAFGPLVHRAALDLHGEDRARFLNGYVTCEVAKLAPGEGAYGFFTDGRGKILADAAIGVLEDRFRLLLPAGRCDAVLAHLERYVLADRVSFDRPEATLFVVAGPEASTELAALGLRVPEADWAVAAWESRIAQRVRDLGEPAVVFQMEAGDGAAGMASRLAAAGCVPVGREALERARVLAGRPRFGADYGPESLPQETGLDDAVSYTKGCYLGQEVVARIHYRGRVQKSLHRLRLAGARVPAPGVAVRLDDEEIGRTGSAVDGGDGFVVALAMLHRKAGSPGTLLTVEGAGPAEVVGPVTSGAEPEEG